MSPQTAVPGTILALIARFEEHREDYHTGRYNETQLRREFLDPLFKALGWDVHNEQGYAEAYRDVIHEDAIHVGGTTEAPDYCFRIGGVRKFFVEAKKPSVDVGGDPAPAYQLRRYAWSAKLPLSILSDFEEFAVYDCRVRPAPGDKASTARVLFLQYPDYADPRRWSEIASIFSRDAILKGSFDRYAESARRKKGTAEVDDAFLEEIEEWRAALARNIALRNPGLSQRQLNYAVQITIDRIVFLRICEDRGIEPPGTLRALTAGPNLYPRLFQCFQRADERYNSGLFYFRQERGRPEAPDELTPQLAIDDRVLKDIISRLYYPESPYEFSVLPADILGHVYEQFLGKVIRLTPGHQAKVEAKPEVRKAGGVYYTPTYIVDYIVRNTVGRLLWGYPAEPDGRCLACGQRGGIRAQGPGRRGEDERAAHGRYTELSGPEGLAGEHGIGRQGLSGHPEVPSHRDLRPDQSTATGGSLAPCQYCGRPCPTQPQGVPPSPGDRTGLPGGDRDPHPVGSQAGLPHRGGCPGTPESDNQPGPHAQRSDAGAEAGSRGQGSGIGGQGSGIGGQGLGVRDQGDGQDPGPCAQTPDPRTLRPGPCAQTPDPRTLRPGPCAQTPDPRALRPDPCAPSPGTAAFPLTPAPRPLTPKQASRLRILDPACGSGSFLLGAFQFLLDWYRDAYVKDGPEKHAAGRCPRLSQHAGGQWQLTMPERKRILLSHLYGVDIDPQAVEVTKLSLLLKVLEGESLQTLDHQLRFFHERALPDLGANIRCGNSLIGPDFYEGRQKSLFDQDEVLRINAFDWHAEFPDILNAGGFHAVIGNPPYVRQEGISDHKEYLAARYASYHGLADLYVYFFERGLAHLREHAFLGYVTSSKFLQASYGKGLRRLMAKYCPITLIDYGDVQVFAGATTYPVIVIVQKSAPDPNKTFAYSRGTTDTGAHPEAILKRAKQVRCASLTEAPWVLVSDSAQRLLAKVVSESTPLQELVGRAQLGIKTSLNKAFVVDPIRAQQLIAEHPSARDLLKPYGRGRDIEKWVTEGNGSFLVCTRESIDISDYPSIRKHLDQFQSDLKARYEVRRGDYEWWVIRQVANTAIFDNDKIVYPDLCIKAKFALNTDQMFPNNTVFCLPSGSWHLLGYLNSKLVWYWIMQHCPANRGGAYRLFNQYMDRLPTPPKLLETAEMNHLVEQMILLHTQQGSAGTDHEKTVLQRRIDATDRQIDALVYDLYGLSADEINIVEEAVK